MLINPYYTVGNNAPQQPPLDFNWQALLNPNIYWQFIKWGAAASIAGRGLVMSGFNKIGKHTIISGVASVLLGTAALIYVNYKLSFG